MMLILVIKMMNTKMMMMIMTTTIMMMMMVLSDDDSDVDCEGASTPILVNIGPWYWTTGVFLPERRRHENNKGDRPYCEWPAVRRLLPRLSSVLARQLMNRLAIELPRQSSDKTRLDNVNS